MSKRRRYLDTTSQNHWGARSAGDTGARANSFTLHPIKSVTSAIHLYYVNGVGNWGSRADSDVPSISVQAGVSRDGTTYTSPVSMTLPQGGVVLSSAISIALQADDTLRISQYAQAASGTLTHGRYQREAWGEKLEYGAGLSAKVAGESISPAMPGGADAYRGFSPAGIIGSTRRKALSAIGHSLVQGDGATGSRGWTNQAAELLDRGMGSQGLWGSNPGGLDNTNGDLDPILWSDVCLVMWSINSINSFADNAAWDALDVADFVNGNGGASVTAHKDVIRDVIRRLNVRGVKVMLCTEGFTGTYGGDPKFARRTAVRAAWNDFVRASGVSYCGAYAVLDTASALEATQNSNTNNAAITTALGTSTGDIHWGELGHQLVAAYVADQITTNHSSVWTEEDANYTEVLMQGWWQAAGLSGLWSSEGWTGWGADGANCHVVPDGYGHLASQQVGFRNMQSVVIHQTQTLTNGRISAVLGRASSDFASGGAVVGCRYVVGFAASTNPTLVGSRATGYWAEAAHDRIQIFRNNTQIAQAFYTTIPVGSYLRLELDKTVDAGTVTLTARLYKDSNTAYSTLSITDTTHTGAMYPAVGQMSNGLDVPTNGTPIIDSVMVYTYNPVEVATVTPSVTTIQIEPGGRRPFSATIIDVDDAPVVTYDVSAASNNADVTVAASITTDAEGVATWTDADCITVSSNATVGETATITLTAGEIDATITVQVVASISGGTSGGDEMTVTTVTDSTLNTLDSSAYELVASAGDTFEIQTLGGEIFLRFSASAETPPSASLIGKRIGDSGTSPRYTLDTGIYAWARAVSAPVQIVVIK